MWLTDEKETELWNPRRSPAGNLLHLPLASLQHFVSRSSLLFSAGLLIYACYGVWHSTLELNAREQQAHASSYQRYDDHLDDTFSRDDSFYPEEQDERPYQGWSAMEEKGCNYQQQDRYQQENQYEEHYGYQSGPGGHSTGGRTNHGFDVGEEEG